MSLTSPLKASSKPLHLYRRNAIWYFRWTFPSAVASLLNRRELKLGLKTPYLRLAAKRGTALAVRMVAFQARAEREQSMTPQVSTQQLETLLRAYVRDALDDFEHDLARRAVAVGNETPDPEIRAIDYIQQDATIRLRQRDTSAEASSALTLATAHGIPLSLDSAALAYLQRGILRADQCVSAVMIDRLRGIYRDDPFLSFPTQGTPVTTPLLVKRLSEVIAEFTADHLRSKRWETKTQTDNAAILRDLLEIIGDSPVSSITKEQMQNYRQTVMRLPPNRTKQPRYRTLCIAEILELPDVKPLSVARINKHFILAAQMFGWAVDKGYLERNPATGLALPKEKRADEARAPFTQGELKQIFFCDEFRAERCGNQRRSPYMFWLPILGLLTGVVV